MKLLVVIIFIINLTLIILGYLRYRQEVYRLLRERRKFIDFNRQYEQRTNYLNYEKKQIQASQSQLNEQMAAFEQKQKAQVEKEQSLSKRIKDFNELRRKLSTQTEEIQLELKNTKFKLQRQKDELASEKQQFSQLKTESLEELELLVLELEFQMDALKKGAKRMKTLKQEILVEFQAFDLKMKTLWQDMKQRESRINQTNEEVFSYLKTIEKDKVDLERHKQEKQVVISERDKQFKQETRKIKTELENLQVALRQKAEELNQREKVLKQKESELVQKKEDYGYQESHFKQLQNKYEQREIEIIQREEALHQKEKSLEKAREELERKQNDLAQLSEENQTRQKELARRKNEINQREMEYNRLKKEIAIKNPTSASEDESEPVPAKQSGFPQENTGLAKTALIDTKIETTMPEATASLIPDFDENKRNIEKAKKFLGHTQKVAVKKTITSEQTEFESEDPTIAKEKVIHTHPSNRNIGPGTNSDRLAETKGGSDANKARFELVGNQIYDANEMHFPLYGQNLPQIKDLSGRKWRDVAEVFIREVGEENVQNKWPVQLIEGEALQQISQKIEASDQTEFVIKICNKSGKLIQNIDFRYFKAIQKIEIEPLSRHLSNERRPPMVVIFHHTSDCDVNLKSKVNEFPEIQKEEFNTIVKIPQRLQKQPLSWEIEANNKIVEVEIVVKRKKRR